MFFQYLTGFRLAFPNYIRNNDTLAARQIACSKAAGDES
jgi:hypothetical protein